MFKIQGLDYQRVVKLRDLAVRTKERLSNAQSAEYHERVANISLFVYIGPPGLHQNSRQAPESSRHSVLARRRFAYIYI